MAPLGTLRGAAVTHGGSIGATRAHGRVGGGGAGTNHHFRVINHRVLDTLWGYTKFELTCGGHLMVALHYSGVWAQVGAGAPRRTTSSIMTLSGVGDL